MNIRFVSYDIFYNNVHFRTGCLPIRYYLSIATETRYSLGPVKIFYKIYDLHQKFLMEWNHEILSDDLKSAQIIF